MPDRRNTLQNREIPAKPPIKASPDITPRSHATNYYIVVQRIGEDDKLIAKEIPSSIPNHSQIIHSTTGKMSIHIGE